MEPTKTDYAKITRNILLLLFFVASGILIIQNLHHSNVQLFLWELNISTAALILLSMLCGAVISGILTTIFTRKKVKSALTEKIIAEKKADQYLAQLDSQSSQSEH